MEMAGGQGTLRAVLMRGGTSRGLFFHRRDLPMESSIRDRLLLAAMGSPDPYGRQIDGLGGGTSSTSKVAILAPMKDGADVEYRFGQVAITRPRIDYRGDCGNLAAAVGLFALEEGLVPLHEGRVSVRIRSANTGQSMVAHVPVSHGRPRFDGGFRIDGVAGSGARIDVDFVAPWGRATGELLPTGHVRDPIEVAGIGLMEATLIDSGNPCVFVSASAFALTGLENPLDLNQDQRLLGVLEELRQQASVRMGLARSPGAAARLGAIPMVGLVAPSPDGAATLVVRMLSMGRFHATVPVTGAIAAAVAASLCGSVPAAVVAAMPARSPSRVRVGHAAGGLDLILELEGGEVRRPRYVRLARTARRLMEGLVHVQRQALPRASASTEPVLVRANST